MDLHEKSEELLNLADCELLSTLSYAFWPNAYEAAGAVHESLCAVLLLHRYGATRLSLVEKTCKALLERARRDGVNVVTHGNPSLFMQSFFRMTLEERWILVLLQRGKWNYLRIGKALREVCWKELKVFDTDLALRTWVEEKAWKLRLQLGSSFAEGNPRIYAGSSPQAGPSCPEWNSDRPWTQRFLDEETEQGRDRFFLQSHTIQCDSCREGLSRSRSLIYQVDKEIFRNSKLTLKLLPAIQQTVRNCFLLQHPPLLHQFKESVKVFIQRKEIRFFMAVGAFFLLQLIRSGGRT